MFAVTDHGVHTILVRDVVFKMTRENAGECSASVSYDSLCELKGCGHPLPVAAVRFERAAAHHLQIIWTRTAGTFINQFFLLTQRLCPVNVAVA